MSALRAIAAELEQIRAVLGGAREAEAGNQRAKRAARG